MRGLLLAASLLVTAPWAAANPTFRVLVLSISPPNFGWLFAEQFSQHILPDLRKQYGSQVQFDLVAPSPPSWGSTGKQPSEARLVANALSGAAWHPSAAEAALHQAASGDTPTLAVVLPGGTVDQRGLCNRLPAAFVGAAFFDHTITTGQSLTDKCVVYPTVHRRAAYIDGFIAGLQAAQTSRKVHILVHDPPDPGAQSAVAAFRQGLADSGGELCATQQAISGAGTRLDVATTSGAWNAAVGATESALGREVAVVYSLLGVYNAASAAATSNKSLANYEVFVSSGPAGGALSTKQAGVQLTRAIYDWRVPLRQLVSATRGGGALPAPTSSDVSTAQWLADWAGGISALTGDALLSATANCTTGLTRRVRWRAVAAAVGQPTLPDGSGVQAEPYGSPSTCLPVPAVTSQAAADEVEGCLPRKGGTVRLIGIAMYVNNLGDIDMKAGSVYVDMNIYLHQYKHRFSNVFEAAAEAPGGRCKPGDFQQNEYEGYMPANDTAGLDSYLHFLTMDRLRSFTPAVQPDGTIAYWRVQGVHYFQPQLQDWPLDTQRLKLVVEEAAQTASNNITLFFCHMSHYAGMSPSARYFPGMTLNDGAYWTFQTQFSCWPYLKYPDNWATGTCGSFPDGPPRYEDTSDLPLISPGDDSCTCTGGTHASHRYVWTVDFVRPRLPTLMKTFLPPLFIIAVNQGAWFLRPQSFETRLGVCGSALLSAVMYHVSIAGQTPPSSVLTWADRFMMVVYVCNLITFFGVFTQSMLWQAGLTRLSENLFRYGRMMGPPACVLAFFGPVVFSNAGGVVAWAFCSAIAMSLAVWLCRPLRRGASRAVWRRMRRLERALPPAMPPLPKPTDAAVDLQSSEEDSPGEPSAPDANAAAADQVCRQTSTTTPP